jgi:hypothetical protein
LAQQAVSLMLSPCITTVQPLSSVCSGDVVVVDLVGQGVATILDTVFAGVTQVSGFPPAHARLTLAI